MRAQIGTTISVLIPAMLIISLYPVLAAVFPAVADLHFGFVPLTLMVLGGGVYPPMVALGFWYVRRAERIEERFGDLLGDR